MKTAKAITLASSAAFLFLSSGARAVDGNFTPNKFEVTFYEIGLTNTSNTSNRFKIFSGEQVVDLASNNTNILSSGAIPSQGNWNAIYAIISNTVRVGGNNGSCYVRSGTASTNLNYFNGVTTSNSANAGNASVTWSSFAGNSSTNPNISTSLNGTQASSVSLYTTNSASPETPTLVSTNRFLFLGSGGISVTTTSNSRGTVQMNFGLRNAMTFANSCTELSYSNMSYGLSVQEF
jgi:hypothetical protein